MYQPPHFREDRLNVQHAMIRAHSFGALVTLGRDGLEASHIPFVLDETASRLGTHRIPWPHVHQICRLERHRIPLRRGTPTGNTSVESIYSITCWPPERAAAARLLTLIRGHGGIDICRRYIAPGRPS
jgi:hypothetical protein